MNMKDSKFENSAKVIGTVSKREFKGNVGKNGIGHLGVKTKGSTVYTSMWGKETGVVKKKISSLNDGDAVKVRGELVERFYDGEYKRNLLNKMVSDDKVYNIDVVDGEKELAILKLSGDVIDRSMVYTKEGIRGKEVLEEVPKIEMEIAVYNNYNRETEKNDLSREQVLINEIKSSERYLKKNSKDIPKEYAVWKNKLDSGVEFKEFVNILKLFKEARQGNLYNISTVHVVAYEDMAERLKEAEIGTNITIGADINTKLIINDYDIIEGSLNELEIKAYAGINEVVDDLESTEFDYDDFSNY